MAKLNWIRKGVVWAGLAVVFLLTVGACSSGGAEKSTVPAPDFYDGKHERLSMTAHLEGIDLETKVLERSYPVKVDLALELPLDEALRVFRVNDKNELPLDVEVRADNVVRIPGRKLGADFPTTLGFLGREHVLINSEHRDEICANVKKEHLDRFYVTFTMEEKISYFDQDEVSANTKREVLFYGTARELCAQSEQAPRYDPVKKIVVLKRPAKKVFPVPDRTPIVVGRHTDLVEGRPLYFSHDRLDGLRLGVALFKKTFDFEGEIHVVIDSDIAYTSTGGVAYYVAATKDRPLRLVGFINIYGSIAPATFILEGLSEEFPYVVVDLN